MTLQPRPNLVTNDIEQSNTDAMNVMTHTLLDKKCTRVVKPEEVGFFSWAFLGTKKRRGSVL